MRERLLTILGRIIEKFGKLISHYTIKYLCVKGHNKYVHIPTYTPNSNTIYPHLHLINSSQLYVLLHG